MQMKHEQFRARKKYQHERAMNMNTIAYEIRICMIKVSQVLNETGGKMMVETFQSV